MPNTHPEIAVDEPLTDGDPLIGTEIDGRFTITHQIGSGGMGAVYAAIQHSISREVAIKVIHSAFSSDKATAMRFLRETWLASRLRSPHIVTVHDFGRTKDGLTYMVMELVEGRTVAAELRRNRAVPAVRAVQITMQICRALETAHAVGVVHRDLKPANIMLEGDTDRVTVLDFGLAKSTTGNNIGLTEAGIIVGTSRYIAPELIRGDEPAATSDLYSLGTVLYTMLSGQPPFVGDELQVLRSHVLKKAPRLTNPVPPALADVVERLLEKDPNKRYASAAELREALALSLSAPAERAATEPPATAALEPIDTMELDETDFLPEIRIEPLRPIVGPPPVPSAAQAVAFPAQRELPRPWRTIALAASLVILLIAIIACGAALGADDAHASERPVASQPISW